MSALAEQRWELAPDALAGGALVAPRCVCQRPLVDGHSDCLVCGREYRPPGTLAREYRQAAYQRRLSWAAGAGLSRREGFKGLSYQLGPNPELTELDRALEDRVEALLPCEGDPSASLGGRAWLTGTAGSPSLAARPCAAGR